MIEPLDDWTPEYIKSELLDSDETTAIEFKAAAKFNLRNDGKPDQDTKDEVALQACAFANSGHGYLVFGITNNKPRRFDDGVPLAINNTPSNDWITKVVADNVYPTVLGCNARAFHIDGVHERGLGILALSVPLSGSRPHWLKTKQLAYVRTGSHSGPMAPQTLLDMATRAGTSLAEITAPDDKQVFLEIPPNAHGRHSIYVRPIIKLIHGVSCSDWILDLYVLAGTAAFNIGGAWGAEIHNPTPSHLYHVGSETLLRGRNTYVLPGRIAIDVEVAHLRTFILKAHLYSGGSECIVRFRLQELTPLRYELVAEPRH